MGNWYEYQLDANKIIESSFALLEGAELEDAIAKDAAQTGNVEKDSAGKDSAEQDNIEKDSTE